MEYTIQKLSRLAGVSTRTLRYYDEIGLLKPARINSSGYRIYGQAEVDQLQQILFYRELDVGLDHIKSMVSGQSYDGGLRTLRTHHQNLLNRRNQIDLLIRNLEKTIATKEGKMNMSDAEKFEGFKKKLVDDNEQEYGQEIRNKYGNQVVEKSNQNVLYMSQDDYQAVTELSEQLAATLLEAMQIGDPASDIAQRVADLHKQWLMNYWGGEYNKEAHAGLAQMYVDDERFTAYYDKIHPGAAVFLRDVIVIYTQQS